MSKIMQNLVVLMEPSEDAYETSLKGGNMILNRFCIDKDAAFELAGVNSLETTSENFQIMGSVESKTMQNLVLLMEPSEWP